MSRTNRSAKGSMTRKVRKNLIVGRKLSSISHFTLSFIANMASEIIHYHSCYKIVVSLDNSFDCSVDGQNFSGLRGFVINQNIPHSCFSPDVNVLVNFVESESILGKNLKNLLKERSWVDLKEVFAPEKYKQVLPVNYDEMSNEQLIPYVNEFLNLFLSDDFVHIAMDARIEQALSFINENLHIIQMLQAVAEQLHLSPEHTRHLFRQEMGIPMSQYLLWQRIRKTIAVAIIEENNLTSASLVFGFTDQPHFNKVFKRVFGLTPNVVIRYSRVLL